MTKIYVKIVQNKFGRLEKYLYICNLIKNNISYG